MKGLPAESNAGVERWQLLRDAATFQLKLALDGLRDLLLIPVSLIAALLSFMTGGGRSSPFYEVVRLGARSERWINLFGIVREQPVDDSGMDSLVGQLELLLMEQYRRGGLTAAAKDRIDQLLDRVERAARSNRNNDASC